MPVRTDRPRLREPILDHLRQAGSDSISGITRALQEMEGSPVHRLTVAGYLAALADEGLLKEVDRPPSKHYQMADPDAQMTLHQRVGRVVAEMPIPAPERPTLTVAVLEHILGRPIFQAELHHAGFERLGVGIHDVEESEEQRRAYRALFRRRHAFDLQIPRADPLLTVSPGALRANALTEAIRALILVGLPGVDEFLPERPEAGAGGVQTHLEFGVGT